MSTATLHPAGSGSTRWAISAGPTRHVHELPSRTSVTVAGTGTMHATAEFIWQIERAALPLRIRDMQLGSSNEGGTKMSLQLNISALTLVPAETGGKNAS